MPVEKDSYQTRLEIFFVIFKRLLVAKFSVVNTDF